MDVRKITLTSHNDFEHFQDLAYSSFRLIENRREPFGITVFQVERTDWVLSKSWIHQIENIVATIKANSKAEQLIERLKEIMSTTNYYLAIYQKEHNINTLLCEYDFKPSDAHFNVVFSSIVERVDIDLPEEYEQALGEGYRLIIAIETGDYSSFVSFLDTYGETPYDKDYLRICFRHLEEFPRRIDKEKPDFLTLYEKLFLEEAS
jgi:hypothetical protein